MTAADRAPGPAPVTVVVARAVAGGREDEFHRWAQRLTAAATFVMTATVIFLLQTLVSTLVRPLAEDWPLLLRSAVTIVPVVALMTWVVMPRLSRWLRGWLYRAAGPPG